MRKIVRNKSKKLVIIVGIIVVVCSIGGYVLFKNSNTQEISPQEVSISENQEPEPDAVVQESVETTPAVAEETAPTLPVAEEAEPTWPVLLTQSEAASLTVVVNKKHKLPIDYVPTVISGSGAQLRSEASNALANLLAAAQNSGNTMKVISSYRSYDTQVSTYNKWVAQSGQAAADTFSARPGHSEHQLGLAADLGNGTCDLEICFGDTNAGKWLASNAQNYGFIIRYPNGKEAITGYQYEPWHIRFVGIDAAKAIVASGQTMDEYYGVPAGGY